MDVFSSHVVSIVAVDGPSHLPPTDTARRPLLRLLLGRGSQYAGLLSLLRYDPHRLELKLAFPPCTPAELTSARDAFDHNDFLFELKMDGFRALAYVGQDDTRLVSRRGNVYKRFTELAAAIHVELDCQAVLDGEIVCLDTNGQPQFYDLLRRRGEPLFYAFDLLWLDGEDLRPRPLIERKRLLRSIVPEQPSVMLYAEAYRADRRGVLQAGLRAGSGRDRG